MPPAPDRQLLPHLALGLLAGVAAAVVTSFMYANLAYAAVLLAVPGVLVGGLGARLGASRWATLLGGFAAGAIYPFIALWLVVAAGGAQALAAALGWQDQLRTVLATSLLAALVGSVPALVSYALRR